MLGNVSNNIKWRILNGDNTMMITSISNYDVSIGTEGGFYITFFKSYRDSNTLGNLYHMKLDFASTSATAYNIIKSVDEIVHGVFLNSG